MTTLTDRWSLQCDHCGAQSEPIVLPAGVAPKAWPDGWQVKPDHACPTCVDKSARPTLFAFWRLDTAC